MSLVYHILDKIPGIYQEEMQIEYEHLATDLLSSGRMRIDTDYYCNFLRFSDPTSGITLMMTKEELTDPKLIELTRKTIKNLYLQKNKNLTNDQITKIITELLNQTKTLLPVDFNIQMQLARILVQSAHPIVIKWLLLDRTQIFNALPYLYHFSTALIYPSIMEGFGIPVLEAMASGTAVITSNCSSLKEAGGEAAILINPNSASDIFNAMKKLNQDDLFRANCIEKGLLHANNFTNEKCAAQVMQVYQKMIL
jgi:glycosyltransferase involved in cell wall biosynthesis